MSENSETSHLTTHWAVKHTSPSALRSGGDEQQQKRSSVIFDSLNMVQSKAGPVDTLTEVRLGVPLAGVPIGLTSVWRQPCTT